MKSLVIKGLERESKILIGERIHHLGKYMPPKNALIITDANVQRHYDRFFGHRPTLDIGTGEKVKTLDTVRDIYQQLIELDADRSTFIVGVGGGIVCDVAGFVASTFLRGVRFGFVPSTLLAQVDASVGGKNGVNFRGYKNIVGVFNQPEFVICDFKLLKTLPEKEIRCGLAEIVKHAAIADADLFEYLEKNYARALELDGEVIEKLVYDSVVIKSFIVNQDEKERAERAKLNFGHSFGHAFEKLNHTTHGEAIGVGMAVASAFSVKKGLLSPADDRRIRALLHNLRLPTRTQFNPEDVLDTIRKDKKRAGKNIKFVFLNRIGNAVVEEVSLKEMRKLVEDLPDNEG